MSKVNFTTNNAFKSTVIMQAITSEGKAPFPLPPLYGSMLPSIACDGYLTHTVDNKLIISIKIETEQDPQIMAASFSKIITALKLRSVGLAFLCDDSTIARITFEVLKRLCMPATYKTTESYSFESLEISLEGVRAFDRYAALIEGIKLCRRLASAPPNIIYPHIFATECLALQQDGIEVKILGPKELHDLGMNALLAVSSGSTKEPRVAVITYTGNPQSTDNITFVGKGVCFDAGGLFIKTQDIMPQMKFDKSGAAAVVGGILAVAKQKLPLNVVGVIGLIENMPDGNACRPSDVVKSMSGKTIEIADPDAEGRMVLADCLYYAYHYFKPQFMVSLGTLTAETIGALASEYAGLFCKHDLLAEKLLAAGDGSSDLLWRLPQGPAFAKQVESEIADLKNLGTCGAGENAAAAEFLHHFVGDTKFAHLDIAGIAWCNEETARYTKGSTGFGVSLIEQICQDTVTQGSYLRS